MQHRRWLLATTGAALAAAAWNAAAQPMDSAKPTPQEMPYKPVVVGVPPAPGDATFAVFRQQLAGVAKNRVHAEMARLVVPRDFFLEGPGRLNPAAAGMDNFAAAIRLEKGGWDRLAAFAAAPSAARLPSRPDILCAPALPDYDPADFDRLLDATGTDPDVWRYTRDARVPMRAGPRPTGPAVDVLGPHLIRVLSHPGPALQGWSLVAAPSGKTGYVPTSVLLPVESDRLCFHKDVTGRWLIAGYIAAAH